MLTLLLPLFAPAAVAGTSCDLSSEVVLNEVMVNPDGSDSGYEWVELKHNGSGTLNLSGWEIVWIKSSSSSGSEALPNGTSITAGQYLVVGESSVSPTPDVVVDLDMGNGSSGDGVYILDCEGGLVDAVVYGDNNDHEITDETGVAATSWAEKPGNDEALARCPDGEDSDESGSDFSLTDGSAGTANGCEGSGGSGSGDDTGVAGDCDWTDEVKINELMVNPDGSDAGNEWVELYNAGSQSYDLSGWKLAWYKSSTSSYSGTASLPSGTSLAAGEFLLIGDENVSNTDVSADLDMGNGSNGDGAYLLECGGDVMDAVIYGGSNTDEMPDESGDVATSYAENPGNDESLGRSPDGADTDQSGVDFSLFASSTPGSANGSGGSSSDCDTGTDIKINEILVNPEGSDGGLEWIELYNNSSSAYDLSGWNIVWYKSASSSGDAALEDGTTIEAGGFLLIGEESVDGADIVAALDFGNGTDGDGVHLENCAGTVVDAVIYGDNNDDGIANEEGAAPDDLAPEPNDGEALGRSPDGEDSDDMASDFCLVLTSTPGEANAECPGSSGTPGAGPGEGGCNNSNEPKEPGSGCNVLLAAPFGGLELALLALAFRRRRD